MKTLTRSLVINSVVLYLLTQIIPTVRINGGLRFFLLAGVILTGLNLLVKPVLNLLLLPINLLTMGFFRWVSGVVILWLLTGFVPQLSITAYKFQGLSYQGFSAPAADLGIFWTLVVGAFLISLSTTLLEWLLIS